MSPKKLPPCCTSSPRCESARTEAKVCWPGLRVAVLASGLICANCSGNEGPVQVPSPLRVMTRNLYLGADLTRLAFVGSPEAIADTVATLWNDAQASDFPARARVLAEEIVTEAPDLVALQEVALYRRQVPGDVVSGNVTPNATEVVLDFLALLTNEIRALGGGYRVAGEAYNGEAELPVADGTGTTFDLRLTDRDVILARDSTQTDGFEVIPYTAGFDIAVGGPGGVPLSFRRSRSQVDAVVGDAHIAFVNTHLEIALAGTTQRSQAEELVAAYSQSTAPLVLLGDFNSAPGEEAYQVVASGFHDAYSTVGGKAPGYTCCQAADLKNASSTADQRIDLVWTRGSFEIASVSVVGSDPLKGRTPGGLWASDHFGVAARLGWARR
jgi:endonuclease/exonuclease/phosphatase family metal-dependent hydrolase